jgi:signal transduction histidine kinase
MQDTHRSTLLLGSIYFLLPCIFLLDVQAPLGVAVAMLYVVPLFTTRWLGRRSHFLTVATLGSIFTLIAPFFSPPAAPLWIDMANRTLILVTLWSIALLMRWRGQAEEEMKRLSRQLLEVQENERRHLARELHDEVMQTLTALKISLGATVQAPATATRQLEESMETVDDLVEQIRSLSLDLRPSMLDDLGLVAALEWYCQRQSRRLAIPVTFSSAPFSSRLIPEIETTCFRIVQEALTNAAKHAQATQVWVSLESHDSLLQITVRDNGIGFDAATLDLYADRGSGIGLRGMEERLRLVDGQLDIAATPGHGTTVYAHVPMIGVVMPDLPVTTAKVADEPVGTA